MASRKGFLAKPSYISGSSSDTRLHPNCTEGVVEWEEAEVWNLCSNTNPLTEAKKGSSSSSSSPLGLKRGSKKEGGGGTGSSVSCASGSLPVNIPDRSKILTENDQQSGKREGDDEGDRDEGIRIPPHEYLARTRGASFSVHEGIGRTLKGRDLRSVRNAIWKKVGFED